MGRQASVMDADVNLSAACEELFFHDVLRLQIENYSLWTLRQSYVHVLFCACGVGSWVREFEWCFFDVVVGRSGCT